MSRGRNGAGSKRHVLQLAAVEHVVAESRHADRYQAVVDFVPELGHFRLSGGYLLAVGMLQQMLYVSPAVERISVRVLPVNNAIGLCRVANLLP